MSLNTKKTLSDGHDSRDLCLTDKSVNRLTIRLSVLLEAVFVATRVPVTSGTSTVEWVQLSVTTAMAREANHALFLSRLPTHR